jgi:molybdate transport system substrate-binding protein
MLGKVGVGVVTRNDAPAPDIASTEAPKGVRLVGPLPAAVQNTTSYTATVLRNAPAPDAARAFIAYLTTTSAKARFAAAGIE